MFNKAKLFKLNILKAMHDDEKRQLQKDMMKSLFIDELSEEEAQQIYAIEAEKRKREALVELGLPIDTDLKALAAGNSAGETVEEAVEEEAVEEVNKKKSDGSEVIEDDEQNEVIEDDEQAEESEAIEDTENEDEPEEDLNESKAPVEDPNS